MKKKILITGVAGFIGSKLAKRFSEEGYNVFGIDDLSSGKLSNVPKNVNFIKLDLADKDKLKLIPKECKLILHLAGQSSGEVSFENPQNDLKRNSFSTLNLIQYGIENNFKKIIYASSMSVYGDYKMKLTENLNLKPLSCYGISKLASENYLRIFSKKIPYLIFRMFNVYGPGQDLNNLKQGMVSIYLSQALNTKKIIIKGNQKRKRDFIYIDDVVEIWSRSIHMSKLNNEIFNLGTGVANSVKDLLQTMKEHLQNLKIIQKGSTKGDQNYVCANNNKLTKKFNYNNFVSLKDGLKKFIDSVR